MPAVRLYTVDDVRAMPDDGRRYETIAGELFATPAPSPRHQEVLGTLFVLIATYVRKHALGKVWFAPVDVVFGPMTLVEPDLLFVRRSRQHLVTDRDIAGAPDLTVEAISPSTKRTDRGRKRALYQEEGVGEYWVVDPDLKQVEVWRPSAMSAEVHRERLQWQPDAAVEPLVIDLAGVFSDEGSAP